MKFSISGIFKQISSFFNKLGKTLKITIIAFIIIAVAGACVFAIVINSNKYAILYKNLTSSEGAEVLSYLQSNAVDVKVQNDGTILVPTEMVAQLRMQLAAEGYPNGSIGYDLFTDYSDLFTTDYETKKLLLFQLQERLQKSIMTIQGVKNAIVTLSISDENTFVLVKEKIDTTASVVLDLYSNVSLTKKQISGIERLVANAVPGLAAENVAIIGSDGEQLNGSLDGNTSVTDVRLETINMINTVYSNKISQFLEPVFGKNSLSIAVNVTVDFKSVVSEETVYTPVIGENGIITWVQRTREGIGNGSGNGSDIPTYEESLNVSGGGSQYSDTFSAEYLVNKLVRQIQDNGGNITDITVAVIVNMKELSDEQRETYKQLIAYSAGISPEKVVLTNAEFKAPIKNSDDESDSDTIDIGVINLKINLDEKDIIIISGAAFIILMFMIFIITTVRKGKKKKKLQRELKYNDEFSEHGEDKKKVDMPGEIVLNETREQALKRQIKDFSTSNPETVAQLLRVWMKEDDEK